MSTIRVRVPCSPFSGTPKGQIDHEKGHMPLLPRRQLTGFKDVTKMLLAHILACFKPFTMNRAFRRSRTNQGYGNIMGHYSKVWQAMHRATAGARNIPGTPQQAHALALAISFCTTTREHQSVYHTVWQIQPDSIFPKHLHRKLLIPIFLSQGHGPRDVTALLSGLAATLCLCTCNKVKGSSGSGFTVSRA